MLGLTLREEFRGRLLKGIEAVGPDQGQPVAIIGERGLGKSHLMAALYHRSRQSAGLFHPRIT